MSVSPNFLNGSLQFGGGDYTRIYSYFPRVPNKISMLAYNIRRSRCVFCHNSPVCVAAQRSERQTGGVLRASQWWRLCEDVAAKLSAKGKGQKNTRSNAHSTLVVFLSSSLFFFFECQNGNGKCHTKMSVFATATTTQSIQTPTASLKPEILAQKKAAQLWTFFSK